MSSSQLQILVSIVGKKRLPLLPAGASAIIARPVWILRNFLVPVFYFHLPSDESCLLILSYPKEFQFFFFMFIHLDPFRYFSVADVVLWRSWVLWLSSLQTSFLLLIQFDLPVLVIFVLSLLPCLLERSRPDIPLPTHQHTHYHLPLMVGVPQGFHRQRRPAQSQQPEKDATYHCDSSSLPGSKINTMQIKCMESTPPSPWTNSLYFWV